MPNEVIAECVHSLPLATCESFENDRETMKDCRRENASYYDAR